MSQALKGRRSLSDKAIIETIRTCTLGSPDAVGFPRIFSLVGNGDGEVAISEFSQHDII